MLGVPDTKGVTLFTLQIARVMEITAHSKSREIIFVEREIRYQILKSIIYSLKQTSIQTGKANHTSIRSVCHLNIQFLAEISP